MWVCQTYIKKSDINRKKNILYENIFVRQNIIYKNVWQNKRIIENNLSDKKIFIKMSDTNTTNTLKK